MQCCQLPSLANCMEEILSVILWFVYKHLCDCCYTSCGAGDRGCNPFFPLRLEKLGCETGRLGRTGWGGAVSGLPLQLFGRALLLFIPLKLFLFYCFKHCSFLSDNLSRHIKQKEDSSHCMEVAPGQSGVRCMWSQSCLTVLAQTYLRGQFWLSTSKGFADEWM